MCSFTKKTEMIHKEVESSKCVYVYACLFLLTTSIVQQWQRDVSSLRWIQESKNCGQILLHCLVRTSLVWKIMYHCKCFENQRESE